MELKRGSIYLLNFKRIFEKEYPNGKPKFVLVLQEGEYFEKYDTVEILLITRDKPNKHHDLYPTDVVIESGSTNLPIKSWIICAQPYPIMKSMFTEENTVCYGSLSPEKMIEVEDAIMHGLSFNLRDELEKEDAFADNFGKFFAGALIGGFVGAGVTKYIMNREKNERDKMILASGSDASIDDTTPEESIADNQFETNEV